MTDNEIRIAVAKACGYRWMKWGEDAPDDALHFLNIPTGEESSFVPIEGDPPPQCITEHALMDVPDYANDLNAMHAALLAQTKTFRLKFETLMDNYCAGTSKLWCELEAREFANIFLQM